MSLTRARLAGMHRLGLFADPVEAWKGSALRNATEGHAGGQPPSRSRTHGGPAAPFTLPAIGLPLLATSVLALVALALRPSSSRSWEALALVPSAGVVTWWCARSIIASYRERRDAHSSIDGAVVDAEAFLAAGDRKLAAALAGNALQVAVSSRHRERLWKVATWSAIAARSPFAAHEALSRLPPRAVDVHIVAAYLGCCNRVREGVELLERARASGFRSAETTRLLIDLHHREGNALAVRALLASDAALLSQRDRDAIESALAAAAG